MAFLVTGVSMDPRRKEMARVGVNTVACRKEAEVRSLCIAAAALAIACGAAHAQLQELFSRYVNVYRPEGEFAPRLIKLRPAGGAGWQTIENAKWGFRIALPADRKPDTTPAENRVLEVVLSDKPTRPRPVLRIDAFSPKPDEPTAIDAEYAQAYAEQYPQAAFGGKFNLADSGYVVLGKKLNMAMVGGTYAQGAARAYRLQWSYLDPDRQLFLTFDCAESEWNDYADTVGRILLRLEVPKAKGGKR